MADIVIFSSTSNFLNNITDVSLIFFFSSKGHTEGEHYVGVSECFARIFFIYLIHYTDEAISKPSKMLN